MALPRPGVLLKESRLYFLDLVMLCQALNIIDDDLALILKKLNTLRNKFAHTRSFNPSDDMINEFLVSFSNMKVPFYYPIVDPNERELALALSSLSGYLEKVVKDYEASNEKRT